MKLYVVTRYVDYAAQITCVDSVWHHKMNADARAVEIDNCLHDIQIFNTNDNLQE